MSGISLSQKARTMSSSTYAPPTHVASTTKVFHSPAVTHVREVLHRPATPPMIEKRVSSTLVRKNNVPLGGALMDIKRRYEDEARQVQQNYEVDFNNHANLVETIEELRILLEDERRRNIDLENKYNGCVNELEKERRLRADFEHENKVLREELRKADGIISDAELRMSRLQGDNFRLDTENKSLRNEIHRLTDVFNLKLRDMEDQYMMQVSDLTGEVDRLRNLLEQQRIDYENRLADLDRDWATKYGRLQEVLREKERLIAELEAELRKLSDYITQLKIEYEEEMRRQISIARDEELHNFHAAVKNLEGRLKNTENDRDVLVRKNQDLVRELHAKERQLQDTRLHLEGEIARLKAEVNDLRTQVTALIAANEKLKVDLVARDSTINRLDSECINIERELNRLKEIHGQEINRLVNDQLNERRRWEEAEKMLKTRLIELERLVKALEGENIKLKTDIERIKQHVSGNVNRTIFQTFVDYEVSNHGVKPLY
jgi:chromosome segregation ATPase